MNDNFSPKTEKAFDDAEATLALLIERNRAAAIPAMVAAMISWAVKNGGALLLTSSLNSALDTLPAAEAAWKAGQQ